MFSNNLFKATVLATSLMVANCALASEQSTSSLVKFTEYTQDSTKKMDFVVVDQLLHAGVLNMGFSTRAYAKKSKHTLGTRFKQKVVGATENEGIRFFYERLKKDKHKILKLRQELEAIPSSTPLNEYSRNAQLAYWLNLYNVTMINEIMEVYPLNNLKGLFEEGSSILDKKVLNVDNTMISLNDIHYKILPGLSPDSSLFIYGLYQGIKGSPNIRRKAYTAKTVEKDLLDNALEFVNSNRGTQFNGGANTVRVSSFYERNAQFFPDFDNDLKAHLQKYAKNNIVDKIKSANRFKTNIDNWRITDLYGSIRRRDYGTYVNNGDGTRFAEGYKLSEEQVAQLTYIMRVRAANFGGGSVTVTDLEPTDEADGQSEEKSGDKE